MFTLNKIYEFINKNELWVDEFNFIIEKLLLLLCPLLHVTQPSEMYNTECTYKS